MIELDIWAILWPVIKQVWGFMSLEQKAVSVGIFFLTWMVSNWALNHFKPVYKRGAVISEVLHFLWGAFTFLLPFLIVGWWLGNKYPLLGEAISFVANKFSWQDRAYSWMIIFFFAVVFVAIQRFVIHKVSMLLQRIFSELPGLGDLLTGLVLVVEAILFVASAVTLPLSMITLAGDRGVIHPISQSVPTVRPSVSVSDEVWSAITTGVERAQANGVSCDPYLMLSIKEYETGTYLCDRSMMGSRNCVSSAGCLGMMQLNPETCQRNAARRGVTCDVWDPARSVEVACYAINDEMEFSLDQSKNEFVREFASVGFVWNKDPQGASKVFDRAINLRASAMEEVVKKQANPAPRKTTDGYIWPAPAESRVSYSWGAAMSYGVHNGMDIILPGLSQFQVFAIEDGKARYWIGDSCDAGVIDLNVGGEIFQYVHMSLISSEIEIPTDGSWVDVSQGQVLGWVHEGRTSCSDGTHLHLMRNNGGYIGEEEFQR